MPGFIVNTNRSEEGSDRPSEKYMLEKGVALLTGEVKSKEDVWLRLLDRIGEGNKVFLYANEVGVVARGIATGETNFPEETFCGHPGRCMILGEFAKLSTPIKFSELPPPPPILAPALVQISDDAAQTIWNIASGRLCWCSI